MFHSSNQVGKIDKNVNLELPAFLNLDPFYNDSACFHQEKVEQDSLTLRY